MGSSRMWIIRSSHQRCSIKQTALENFAIFTGKHLCRSLFFVKVASLRPETLFKKRLQHRCFLVNIKKFLRAPILKNICECCFWIVMFPRNHLHHFWIHNFVLHIQRIIQKKYGRIGFWQSQKRLQLGVL